MNSDLNISVNTCCQHGKAKSLSFLKSLIGNLAIQAEFADSFWPALC
jgi:hypothetical protein